MPVVDSPFEELTPGFRPVRARQVPVEDEIPEPPAQPIDWRRLWFRSLLITVVVLAAGVAWYFTHPRSYHLVRQLHFAQGDVVLLPSQQGFLLRKSQSTFALFDWYRGDEIWHVDVDAQFSAYPLYSLRRRRYFAVLTYSQFQSRLQVWDNGKLDSDITFEPNLHARVQAMDDGRVLVWPSLLLGFGRGPRPIRSPGGTRSHRWHSHRMRCCYNTGRSLPAGLCSVDFRASHLTAVPCWRVIAPVHLSMAPFTSISMMANSSLPTGIP